MFIEFVDSLRCPHPHAESWLVASAERMEGRDIVTGVLGCPVCKSQFAIADGVADFRAAPAARSGPPGPARDAGDAERMAALLDLTDDRGYAVLSGEWTVLGPAIRSLTGVHVMLVNPLNGIRMGGGISGMAVDDVLPLAPRSARGIALSAAATPQFLASAFRAVAPLGRVVAPVAVPVPREVSELARDSDVWVGVNNAEPGAIVELRRTPPPATS